jgi:hypothetical protein
MEQEELALVWYIQYSRYDRERDEQSLVGLENKLLADTSSRLPLQRVAYYYTLSP